MDRGFVLGCRRDGDEKGHGEGDVAVLQEIEHGRRDSGGLGYYI